MRKIISLILIGIMLCSFVPTFAEDVSSYELSAGYSLMLSLGIMEEASTAEEFNENIPVTRGEFASAVANAYGINHSEYSKVPLPFKDVSRSDENYAGIAAMYSMDLMLGYNADEFRPDEHITGIQAIKVLVHALGYDAKTYYLGGYPSGYYAIENQLGLTKNTESFSYSDTVTLKQLARLIINLLRTHPYDVTGVVDKDFIYSGNERTFGDIYKSVNYGSGIVSGNSETMLVDHADLSEGKLLINNVIYDYGKFDDEYIGREVEYFYSTDELTENKIKAIALKDKKNSEFVLSADEIAEVSGNKIKYDDGNGDFKTISLSSDVTYIYNGKMILSCNLSEYKNSETCMITFLDNNGALPYDIVFINNYTTYVAENVSYSDKIITDKATAYNNNVSAINKLDISETSKEVIIRDKDGNEISFDEIIPGNVITFYENTTTIKIYVSADKAVFILDAIEDKYFVSGSDYYRISNKLAGKLSLYTPGSLYQCALDIFGRVVDLKEGESDGYKTGCIVNCNYPTSDFKDTYYKFYTTEGKFETYTVAEKFMLNGSIYTGTTIPDILREEAKDSSGAIVYTNNIARQLVKYKIDSNGELKELITADTSFGENGTTFFRVRDFNDTYTALHYASGQAKPNKIFQIRNGSRGRYITLGRKVNISQSTIVIKVPEDNSITEESEFEIIPFAHLLARLYSFDAYYMSTEAQFADVVMLYSSPNNIAADSNAGVISKSTIGVNNNGESVRYLTLYVNGTEVKYPCKADINGMVSTLNVGDVVRFGLDKDKQLTDISLVYDTMNQDVASTAPTLNSADFTTGMRTVYGQIARISDGVIRVGTDLERIYQPDETYLLESYDYTEFRFVVIDERVPGRRIVKPGTPADFDIGDRVVAITRTANPKVFALIKD